MYMLYLKIDRYSKHGYSILMIGYVTCYTEYESVYLINIKEQQRDSKNAIENSCPASNRIDISIGLDRFDL